MHTVGIQCLVCEHKENARCGTQTQHLRVALEGYHKLAGYFVEAATRLPVSQLPLQCLRLKENVDMAPHLCHSHIRQICGLLNVK